MYPVQMYTVYIYIYTHGVDTGSMYITLHITNVSCLEQNLQSLFFNDLGLNTNELELAHER